MAGASDAGKSSDIPICDPHFHFWDTKEFRPVNNLGDLGEAIPLYGTADYIKDFEKEPLASCVHVEATVSRFAGPADKPTPLDSVAETKFVVDYKIPIPHSIVPFMYLPDPDLEGQIKAHLAVSDRVTGIRMICNHSDTDPALTYPHIEKNWVATEGNSDFLRGLALLPRHGLTYDCHITPEQMVGAAAAAKACPEAKIVINHYACPRFNRGDSDAEKAKNNEAMWRTWREGLKALAGQPNVSMKLSNPAVPCDDFHTSEASGEILRTLTKEAIGAFGPERSMFAANWPVDRHQAGVDIPTMYGCFREWVKGHEEEAIRRLFHDTAASFYRIKGADIKYT